MARIPASFAAVVGLAIWSGPVPASEPAFLLWQTNAGGNDIHVFDAETGALLRRLEVGPAPHGIAATADHRTVFVTVEANGARTGELVWIDAATFAVARRIELCREPHALAATPDGRWLYVPCRDGRYRVVNGLTGEVAASVATGGRPHNTQISADGRFAYLSPMGRQHATVIDIQAGHRPVGGIEFADSLRPSALSADGRWLVQHVDRLNGFQVADTRAGAVVATIEHATPLDGIQIVPGLGRLGLNGFERCHGIAIDPAGSEIWSVCAETVTIHALEPPTFAERARVALPHKGYWISFSPDGRRAYVALADAGEVALIDAASRRVERRLVAGASPKRNLVLRRAAARHAMGASDGTL